MGQTCIRDKIASPEKEVSLVHPWRRLTLALFAVTGWLVVAACGSDPTPATTFTSTPTSTPTVVVSPTPDLSVEPVCFATEAYALEYPVAVIGRDPVPTEFDAVNRGGCQFEFPVAQITVTLTGEDGSQTAVIPLDAPANDVEFPLSSSMDVPVIEPKLPPGRYERTVAASTASGEPTPLISGFEPVILVDEPNSLLARLLRAESRWERSSIRSYTYRASWQCFCLQEYVAQVDVRVVNDQVVDVKFAEPGFSGEVPEPERFGLIGDRFDFIRDAIEQEAPRIDVEFHPELGYPQTTFVDFNERIADEEQGFTILTLSSGIGEDTHVRATVYWIGQGW